MSCEIQSEDQKVFCVNCAYFNSCRRSNARKCYDGNYSHEICNAPQNIRPTYMSDGSNKYVSSPSVINQYNNCKWFLPNNKPTDLDCAINEHNKNHNSHPFILENIETIKQDLIRLNEKISGISGGEEVFNLTSQDGIAFAIAHILTSLGVPLDRIISEDNNSVIK